MEQIPFPPYVQPGTQAYQKGMLQLPENYCYVSTLNSDDAGQVYTYRAFRIAIPKGLIKKTKKTGNPRGWVTFRYVSQKALSRTEADTATLGKGGIVRMARCLIPKSKEIVGILFDQFTKFGQASWISYYKSAGQATNTTDSATVASDIMCIDWGAWCVGTARCKEAENWTYYCRKWIRVGGGGNTDGPGDEDPDDPDGGADEDGGGGRGGRGGKTSDPCSPGADDSIPIGCREPIDCAGVPDGSAYIDACGICVGGTTDKISCCASRKDLIDQVIEDEGGYNNDDPDDPGGKTNHGITEFSWQAYAQNLFGINPDNVPVSSITVLQARTIYRQIYYPLSWAKKVSKLDGDLGKLYFDIYVNTGVGASKSLQKALNSLGYNISVDGVVRNETLDAIKNAIKDGKLVELFNRYKDQIKQYFLKKIEEEPSKAKYKDGWFDRVEDFLDKTNAQKRNVNCGIR